MGESDPLARLAAVAARSAFAGRGGDGVLEHGRKGLRARGIVGVIATEGCQLEILPKIEGGGEAGASDAQLRGRLIHMLGVVHDLRIDAGEATRLGWQNDTLLELLIRLFCQRLVEAARQGMPRRYVAHEDDLPALRGRLDVTRQFSRHAAAPQRLACRFDDLSPDIPLNQVMRATVDRLRRLAQAPENQRLLRELGFFYSEVSAVPVPLLPWGRIQLDRTNQRWSGLLAFARLFLSGRHQQTSAGAVEGHALLFEMNALFERYVGRQLSRALSGTGLRVTSQGGHRDCLYEGETGRFRTRPDFIIRRGDEIVLVLDTKWKRMTPRIDDAKQGVSQADVYQLMAYSQLYDCKRVMLLYPHHAGLPEARISTRYAIAAMAAETSLRVATLDVSGPGRAQVRDLGELIAQALEG